MYQYMPKGDRGKLKGICMAMFAGGVVLFFASGIKGILYPAIMQTAAVLIITATIMIMGRYLLRHYLYRIADDGEGLDFLVDEISRNGRYTICRLSISQLVSARPYGDDVKPQKGTKVYNYCVEIKPRDSWLLEFLDGEDRIFVRISPDDKLKEIVSDAARGHEEAAQ